MKHVRGWRAVAAVPVLLLLLLLMLSRFMCRRRLLLLCRRCCCCRRRDCRRRRECDARLSLSLFLSHELRRTASDSLARLLSPSTFHSRSLCALMQRCALLLLLCSCCCCCRCCHRFRSLIDCLMLLLVPLCVRVQHRQHTLFLGYRGCCC